MRITFCVLTVLSNLANLDSHIELPYSSSEPNSVNQIESIIVILLTE